MSSRQPAQVCLPWLMRLDVDERSMWVEKLRYSSKTLGSVIKDVMIARDSHWGQIQTIPVGMAAAGKGKGARLTFNQGPKGRKGKGKGKKGKGKGGKVFGFTEEAPCGNVQGA